MIHRLFPAVAVLAAIAVPATAGAAQFNYKVVQATHTSSSSKSDELYTGHSTASWSLAKPTGAAPNRVQVSTLPGMVTGMGQVNVTGKYSIDAANADRGHCVWSTFTGDQTYPGVAPQDFTLAVGPNPDTGKGIYASWLVTQASLSNGYLGSECSTSVSGEPDPQQTSMVKLSRKDLKKKTLVLRNKGTSAEEGITYSWSTTIVLKRR